MDEAGDEWEEVIEKWLVYPLFFAKCVDQVAEIHGWCVEEIKGLEKEAKQLAANAKLWFVW